MSLYTHWVRFDCRKSFNQLHPTREGQAEGKSNRKCPDCERPMTDMGIYFEPPRRRAMKAWEIMQLLAASGYRFQTEGSKAFIDTFILATKRPTVKDVERNIA